MQVLNGDPVLESDALGRIYGGTIYQLDAGDSVTIASAGATRMYVKLGAGATLTWSPVDSPTESAHDTDHDTAISVQPSSPTEVAWPFHHVSVSGGDARVAFLP